MFLYLVNAGALRRVLYQSGGSFLTVTVAPIFLFLTSPTAAYPDGHPEGVHNEDEEIEHLNAKVESGADFIVIANVRRRQLPSMVTEDPRPWCVTFLLHSRTHTLILR